MTSPPFMTAAKWRDLGTSNRCVPVYGVANVGLAVHTPT